LDIDILQVSFLAIIQGITEFLPISSSGHLILPSALWGWEDQGLIFDVSVHAGSLFAVVYYFRVDILRLGKAWFSSIPKRQASPDSKLAWLLIMSTIPAGIAGFLLNDIIEQYARSMLLIASTSIVFAILLFVADKYGSKALAVSELNWKKALFIGLAQVLALMPGTSRSGVTMTAGLLVNLSRKAASRFSFLLAIPIIAASGLLKSLELYQLGVSVNAWIVLLYGVILSGLVSLLCIHYFLKFIENVGFLPFVIYRILLGLGLLLAYFA